MARRVGAQHQRVDEEADEVVERAVGATGDRAADRDVGARSKPRQERGERRLQHHEQAGPAVARQRQQTTVQLRRQGHRHAVAAIARHRGPRPVERQVELIGQAFQPLGPVSQLARDRAFRIALLAQDGRVPERVIGVLHRQSRQLRRDAATACRVGGREIPHQRRHRPAVARDVMQQQEQHVLALAEHKQMRPQRRLVGDIEGLPRRRRERRREPFLGHGRHRQPRARRGGIEDRLPRHPQRVREDRAQAFMARDCVAQRAL